VLAYENIYRSLIAHARSFVPSGVVAIDGEAFGIRLDDPTGKAPSVTVTIEEQSTAAVELGSNASRFSLVYTIDAQSRRQRDALKHVVFTALTETAVPIYTAFDDFTPASGASVVAYGEYEDNVFVRDMPNLDSGRERFFWTALVFADITIIGA
jgi:hypothetical protein